MATRVGDSEVLELQDGSEVEVRPLSIKRLRKFMELVKGFENVETEEENIDVMVSACAIAIEQPNPGLAADREKLEDALDVPTMWKILELAGGVKMNDPNLLAAAAAQAGTTSTSQD